MHHGAAQCFIKGLWLSVERRVTLDIAFRDGAKRRGHARGNDLRGMKKGGGGMLILVGGAVDRTHFRSVPRDKRCSDGRTLRGCRVWRKTLAKRPPSRLPAHFGYLFGCRRIGRGFNVRQGGVDVEKALIMCALARRTCHRQRRRPKRRHR